LLGESANNQVVLKHERELLFEILVKSGVRQSARRVVITRMVDGQPTMVQVDLTTNEKYTTLVQHGDIIEVQAASSDKVFLTGEVKTIGTIEYTTGLTLSQAIILAGGTSEFAKRSKIEVRRKSSTGKPEIIKANLDNIIRGKDPDIELKPNDTIYVPRRFL
jgi:protein involved in polysaccharide export with SLBB domain